MFRRMFLQTTLVLLIVTLAACSTAMQPAIDSNPNRSERAVESRAQPAALEEEPPATTNGTDQDLTLTYPIVDSGQTQCYNAAGIASTCPDKDEDRLGQDAQYQGNSPSYTDNGDGTISDNVSGLMWQQSPDRDGDGAITAADKLTYEQALAGAQTLTLGGHSDWRLPTIKELYSLILFDGSDPSGVQTKTTADLTPFIDTGYFDFAYGDSTAGERIIDAQYAANNLYSGDNGETMFGVNFADGRIKGYGLSLRGQEKTFFVIYVRGNPSYGNNDFVSANDASSVTDRASGLQWQRDDSGAGMNWADALAYCENLSLGGYDDWRLPNVKELQSIVDYSRAPDSSGSAAIDPQFNSSSITNEAGQADYPAYWSSTTHANTVNGHYAAYVTFGRALGYMNGAWIDIHGAGAQRSDPKTGDPANYPSGHGPQGDAIRINNYARCVRDDTISLSSPDNSRARPTMSVDVSTGNQIGEQPPNGEPPSGELAAPPESGAPQDAPQHPGPRENPPQGSPMQPPPPPQP